MNAQTLPTKSKVTPLIPTVRVCVLCNPGKQADNYVCPACEKEFTAAVDAAAIQSETWSDYDRCQRCTGKIRFPNGNECKWDNRPEECPAVQDVVDVISLALTVPEVMTDFILDTSDPEGLAKILVNSCGNTELQKQLTPLIAQWAQNRTEKQVKEYVNKHYGA